MGNKAGAKKLLAAVEEVLAANKNIVEVLSETMSVETDNPKDFKEGMDAFGGLVQAFFGIDVGLKKLRTGLREALEKNEKTD